MKVSKYQAEEGSDPVIGWCIKNNDKKSKGCALCKTHKHGWAPKKKVKERVAEMESARLVDIFMRDAEEEESVLVVYIEQQRP